MTWRIRRAQTNESETLSALAFRSKAHWGYDQAFMEAHRKDLSLAPGYIAGHPTYLYEHAAELLGFYALARVDEQWAELDFMFVDPAHLGRGIGRTLFEHARAMAGDMGHRYLRIVSDPHAAGFYRQMGAELWGEWHSGLFPGRRLPVLQMLCAR